MYRLKNSIWGPVLVICLTIVVSSAVTATAAKLITGKQIKNNSVTSVDIKNKTLTGNDVKDGTLLGADVKDGDIGGADVKDGDIGTADIQDGSIGASDLQSGVVPTVPGPAPIGVVTSNTPFATAAGNGNVPGMSMSYTSPAGTNKLIVTFSAECEVTSLIDDQYITARILVDGVEAGPVPVTAPRFCSPPDVNESSNTGSDGENFGVGASIQRTVSVGPGTHTIQAQAGEFILATGTLDGMTLTVTSGS